MIFILRGLPSGKAERGREGTMKKLRLKKHQLERLHEIQFLWQRDKERKDRDQTTTTEKTPPNNESK